MLPLGCRSNWLVHPKCRGTAQDCIDNQGGCFAVEEVVYWGGCYEVSAGFRCPC